MRIGIYDPYLDDLGGGEKYMITAAECLSKDHDVFVFWDDKSDLEEIKKRFAIDISKISLTVNIFSKKINFWKRLNESKKYDVIIILSDGSIPFVLSKKLFIHFQQPLSNIGNISIKSKLKLSRVSGIFYNSKFTKYYNDINFPGVKNTIIYPPVDYFGENSPKENIILHVGRFRVINVRNEDYKKQQVMVDTFKKIVDKGLKGWKFIVATSINDDKDARFIEMVDSAKGYPIEFLINKSNRYIWEIYNKAKIYWHASGYGEDLKKHPEYAEHFGISTVEAMGAGAVPVVIRAGGQMEIVEDGINGFLWESVDELIKKTNTLINDNKLLEKISKNSRKRSKYFSKEIFAKRLKELIG